MINSDDIARENIKYHNPNWPQISDDLQKIIITGGSGYWKNKCIT